MGSIHGSGRSPRGGRSNPRQYSCLENPTERGAWQAILHTFAKSQTRLKQLSRHTVLLSGWFEATKSLFHSNSFPFSLKFIMLIMLLAFK